jgi:hypothetical protein
MSGAQIFFFLLVLFPPLNPTHTSSIYARV